MSKFIVFEGIDGCGKTTQLNMVYNYLKKHGYNVVKLQDPGTTELGDELRKILLHKKTPVSKRAETLLFLAARSQLVVEQIKPYLEKDYIVLLDRFSLSTYVYQGKVNLKDLEIVKTINNFATYGIKPDLMLVYNIDFATYRERVGVKDNLEKKYEKYVEKLIYYYKKIGKQLDAQFIDGTQSIPDVFKETKKAISKQLFNDNQTAINIEDIIQKGK